jgi:hypothetical protein
MQNDILLHKQGGAGGIQSAQLQLKTWRVSEQWQRRNWNSGDAMDTARCEVCPANIQCTLDKNADSTCARYYRQANAGIPYVLGESSVATATNNFHLRRLSYPTTHGTIRLPLARSSWNIACPERFYNNPSANLSLVTAWGKQQALYVKTYSSRLTRWSLLRMWVDAYAQDFVANDGLLLPILKTFVLRLLEVWTYKYQYTAHVYVYSTYSNHMLFCVDYDHKLSQPYNTQLTRYSSVWRFRSV